MKKIIAVALLSTFVATPSFAEDTAARSSGNKSASAMSAKQGYRPMKDECYAGHGMGMMGGMGSGMIGGMGSGMMGGMGSGMMGGMGSGMMGGMGSGMMMGFDMHMSGTLALSDEQRSKINKISDEFKHNNWATQGLLNDETAKLRDLYEADKRDPAAIGKEYQKIFDLKRQMIEAYLNTQNSIEEILTAEQRAKLKDMRRGMHRMYGHPMQ